LSKSVTQSEEKIKQMIIDSLRDIEWDIMQGKIDTVMTKLEEAQKLAREWRAKNLNSSSLRVTNEHQRIKKLKLALKGIMTANT
jgi:hypothetical protein